MAPPAQPRKPIGFRVKERRAAYRVKESKLMTHGLSKEGAGIGGICRC